jgi:hypothetical protein
LILLVFAFFCCVEFLENCNSCELFGFLECTFTAHFFIESPGIEGI